MLKFSDRPVPRVCGDRKWFMKLFVIKTAYILVTKLSSFLLTLQCTLYHISLSNLTRIVCEEQFYSLKNFKLNSFTGNWMNCKDIGKKSIFQG